MCKVDFIVGFLSQEEYAATPQICFCSQCLLQFTFFFDFFTFMLALLCQISFLLFGILLVIFSLRMRRWMNLKSSFLIDIHCRRRILCLFGGRGKCLMSLRYVLFHSFIDSFLSPESVFTRGSGCDYVWLRTFIKLRYVVIVQVLWNGCLPKSISMTSMYWATVVNKLFLV